MNHDQLQSKCFLWMWNNHPELRGLFHCNLNNLTSYGGSKKAQQIQMAKLIAKGHCIKGRLDFEFYFKRCMFVMDFKVGSDKLSKEQLEYIRITEENGGVGCEIRSLEEFQLKIKNIIDGDYTYKANI